MFQKDLKFSPDIKRLYLFHFFNGIALTVVANFLFVDKLLLRMNFDMQQFGFIKGIAWFLPVLLNLVLSPFILNLNRDKSIVACGYLMRVVIPYALLLLPELTGNKTVLTFGCATVLLTSLVFPILANNSIAALCKVHIPENYLGRHMSWIMTLWTAPGYILSILCSYYIDLHSNGGDGEFYSACFKIFFFTTVFQVFASLVIMRLTQETNNTDHKNTDAAFGDICLPFKDGQFRVVLAALFLTYLIVGMFTTFINPFLLNVKKLSMTDVSIIGAVASIMSAAFFPLWGKMTDRVGGRNVWCICALGLGTGIFCLLGHGIVFICIYALFCWGLTGGFFGCGLSISTQYLLLAKGKSRLINIYLAASSLAFGWGLMTGSILGGCILKWLKTMVSPEMPNVEFHIYFTYCALACFILVFFVSAIRERKTRMNSLQMVGEIFQETRSLFS